MQSIVFQETFHWMTRICIRILAYIMYIYIYYIHWIQRKKQILTGLWIFDFENVSPFLKRITHKQLYHLPPKLVCFFFVPGLFFCDSICNMHSHDGQCERFSQVSSCPDTEEFRFVWVAAFKLCCPAIAEEFGRIHIADLFVVPSMLDTLHCM